MPSYSFLRLELAWALAPWGLLFLGSTAGAWASGLRLLRLRPQSRRLRHGEVGSTELEFAIAFPLFLITVLTTIQLALMLNANLVVDYAAFCAARSTSVWVGQEVAGEPANVLSTSRESEKMLRIRRAASLACVPISPRMSSWSPVPPAATGAPDAAFLSAFLDRSVVPEMHSYLSVQGLAGDVTDKWVYSWLFTDVRVQGAKDSQNGRFKEGAPVQAVVKHKFEMAVPFAGAALGRIFGDRYVGLVGGYYVPLEAQYTMMTWGFHEAR